MATVTEIRPGVETPADSVVERIVGAEIALGCLEERLVARYGKRALGRAVLGRIAECWEELEAARLAYRGEADRYRVQVDRFEDYVVRAQRVLGIQRAPALELVKGGDDAS